LQFFKREKGDSEWVGISDIMSGVMMVFLFLAVLFMLANEREKESIKIERDEAEKISEDYRKTQEAIKEIAVTYRESQKSLNSDLHREFDRDLDSWGAEITDDNRIRFNSPHILFKAGSYGLTEKFASILKELFPRYLKLVTSDRYKKDIDEIRIEGHTSYGWGRAKDEDYIYKKNMELSQRRASSVLNFCYSLPETESYKSWVIEKFRANGMAYSNPIRKESGKLDYDKSRRVELTVTTKATEKIYKIIEELN
jgi:chemotaxis protein MotB